METELFDSSKAINFRPKESLSIGSQLLHLRAAIIRGELLPGQAISEIQMSKRFSISRQPVREAFIKLGEEHLIEVLPQRGTYVRKISVKEVLDARHLREVIEVSIVREVALNHDKALIKSLREIIAQQQAVHTGDNQAFLALDDGLHKAIALHAHREYAWKITETIKAQMDRAPFSDLRLLQHPYRKLWPSTRKSWMPLRPATRISPRGTLRHTSESWCQTFP